MSLVLSLLVSVIVAVDVVDALAGTSVYIYVDRNSVVHFTDAPTDSKFIRVRKFGDLDLKIDIGIDYLDEVYVASEAYEVDPALVLAVLEVESGFNVKITSSRGAMGLMQLMPNTAKRYKVTDAYNAAQNIRAGVRHLKYLLSLFGGDVALALAAYNAGEEAVRRYGGIPPYPETRRYIRKVLDSYHSFR